MANKMNTAQDLDDRFLSDLIRSESLDPAPDNFCDEVMNQIDALPSLSKIKPYTPPRWVKWGIPGILVLGGIMVYILGNLGHLDGTLAGSDPNHPIIDMIGNWMSKTQISLNFPEAHLSHSTSWILLGIVVLFWSFYFLNQLLTKKSRQRATR